MATTNDEPPTQPEELRDAGVFKQNRQRPIHRWYPFVEGFASDLVHWAIGLTDVPTPRLFDPFGGSGTTALTAATLGLDSAFCEVNPYLAWLADVKINAARDAYEAGSTSALGELSEVLEDDQKRLDPQVASHPLLIADARREYFPPTVAQEVVGTLEYIESSMSGPSQQLAMAAVAVSLVPCSNMVRRTDLRRRTQSDPPPKPFRESVIGMLRQITHDVDSVGGTLAGSVIQLAADIREMDVPDIDPFDLIVTSPPYLNGTNYERNTKLELLALQLIPDENSLSTLRKESITAGINGVSRRRPQPRLFPEVERFASELDEVAYDVRIPALVRGYFSDMTTAMERMRAISHARSELILDIGDSRFAGVSVPTPDLLAQLAAQVGWELKETFHVRDRRSYDGTPLVQVIQRMVAV